MINYIGRGQIKYENLSENGYDIYEVGQSIWIADQA